MRATIGRAGRGKAGRWTGLLAVGLCLLATPVGAQAGGGCFVTRVRVCGACISDKLIVAKAGQVCLVRFESPSGSLVSQTVVRRAQKGIYGKVNVAEGAYKASPGASGQDYFEVDIAYEDAGARGVMRLKASVEISP